MKKAIAVFALMAACASIGWSQDGGALFKAKCAMCHGADGQGKPNVAPKLAATTKSKDAIAALLTKGGAPKGIHIKPMSSLDAAQAGAVAAFVKTLK